MPINVNTSNNTVVIQPTNYTVTVTNNNAGSTTNVTNPYTAVINVASPGPQGIQGVQGVPGDSVFSNLGGGVFATTSSILVTGSFTVSGSSTFTNIGPAIFSGSVNSQGGFTGSLQGTASYATINLQQVTDLGSTTTNDINVNSVGVWDSVNSEHINIGTTDGGILISGSSFLLTAQADIISFGQIGTRQVTIGAGLVTGTKQYELPNQSGTVALTTGSIFGTASWAAQALTASYLNTLNQDLIFNGISTLSGSLNITGSLNVSGNITGSNATSLLDLSQTWNTSGTPIAIKLNITDTTSAALSDLMSLQVGGSARFRVLKSGFFTHNTGGEIAGNLVIGGSTIDASSQLEVRSTTKGFLPPRMTNAQRVAISTPAVGLMVYCTDATEGLYVYKSTGWTFIV